MPVKRKRFKMESTVCHATFDNEYRKRHELCHSDYLKVQRHVRYKVAGALDSPFVVR